MLYLALPFHVLILFLRSSPNLDTNDTQHPPSFRKAETLKRDIIACLIIRGEALKTTATLLKSRIS
jgi:hypothetical protein